MLSVVAADQLSKLLVEHVITRGEEHKLLPGVELVNTRNRGVAFGVRPEFGATASVSAPTVASAGTS